MNNISFISEDIKFEIVNPLQYTSWINSLISSYNKIGGEITYVFCSDSYLLKLNKEHLGHNTYTDIITFDYTEMAIISGDIFISIDRIRENAVLFSQSFNKELQRVMSHGVLHLIGFKDKTSEEKIEMTKAEENALELLITLIKCK